MELKKLIKETTVHADLLNELLQVLERETAEMGDVNIAAMAVSNQSKEELIARIADHSLQLQRAISEQASQYGLSGPVTLSSIAEYVAKKGDRELLVKQQQILSTIERVQQVAVLNREIADRFSSSIASSLTLITRMINQSNIYGSSGGYQRQSASAVMINREA
jgi:hypothetical protein